MELGTIPQSDRQQREIDFHRDYARRQEALAAQPVSDDILQRSGRRRWWNSYWSLYDRLLAADLGGRRVLIPGCGFGEDAVRLGMLGAEVWASDISPDVTALARARCDRFGYRNVQFDVCSAEALPYEDSFFDAVVIVGMLHHADIEATMREVRRVLKPGGRVIGSEPYTYTALQNIRESRFVTRVMYPRLQKWIYGTSTPYITDDERKLDERDLAMIRKYFADFTVEFFSFMEGRLFSNKIVWASMIDRTVIRATGPLARYLGGVMVFRGTINK